MVRILLVSFGSEWHNDVWNVLAIESLVGDLEGYFGNNIQISTFRFYTEDDIYRLYYRNMVLFTRIFLDLYNTTLQLLKKSNAQGTFRSIISLQTNPYERE